MISSSAGHYPEMVRWYMDYLDIPYIEKRYAPMIYRIILKITGGGQLIPYLRTTDAQLRNGHSIIKYFEDKLPDNLKLGLVDGESQDLYDYFNDHLGNYVLQWGYFHLLPLRKVASKTLTANVPFYQRILIQLLYPINARVMRKAMNITSETASIARDQINKTFDLVAKRMSDGRSFLNGDQISIADISLAGLMGPLILPKEYGGYLFKLDELTKEMRAELEALRSHPTGRFILKLYKEHRPQSKNQAKLVKRYYPFQKLFKSFVALIPGKELGRLVFAFLRNYKPVLLFGKRVFITSHRGVVEGLSKDDVFTIKEINAAKMEALEFPFMLGMDRSPQHDREKSMLRGSVKKDDLQRIRSFTTAERDRLLHAQIKYGKIDIVNSYARPVATRLSADYFGLEIKDELRYMHWMRILFWECFLNLSNDKKVKENALEASRELKEFMTDIIHSQEQKMLNNEPFADNLLTRLLLAKKEHEWIDNDTIRRNLCGLMIGALDTTTKVLVRVVEYFAKNRSKWEEFRALSKVGDDRQLTSYWLEALRFNPHNPVLLRYAASATEFHGKKIPPGSTIFFVHLSAMFDPKVYLHPREFRTGRDVDYLHFGYGEHRCFGEYINYVQVTELLKGLTVLNLLQCLNKSDDGPFPDSMVLKV